MTDQEWRAECDRRISAYEGNELVMYHDNKGIPTIAKGFNLTRPEAADILRSVGVSDPGEVIAGRAAITEQQVEALFQHDLTNFINAARASLSPGVFDRLSDARRFVVVDLTYNMGPGEEGWGGFGPTHALIAQAMSVTDPVYRHFLFGKVGDHLAASKWARDVPERAAKDIQMMRLSTWIE
jgi:GH24 family phage-related lysozyme (muramidase)